MNRKYTIEDVRKVAAERGGYCFSDSYINNNEKMKFMCSEGHVWSSVFSSIRRGTWCPDCANNKRRLDYLLVKDEISKLGGEVLSDKYINNSSKLEIRCKNGHTFDMNISSVRRGGWCPTCRGRKRVKIDDARSIAKSRGGYCLSKHINNMKDHLTWKCKNGHVWNNTYWLVKQGSWCPNCKYSNESKCRYYIETLTGNLFSKTRKVLPGQLEFDGYSAELNIAFEYQGKQHYEFIKHFYNSIEDFLEVKERDKIKKLFCDKKGINFIVIPYWEATNDENLLNYVYDSLKEIINKSNIKKVKKEDIISRYYIDCDYFSEAENIINKKKGSLNKIQKYNGYLSELEIFCEKGHVWITSLANIKSGSWCPKCAGVAKYTIEELNKYVNLWGGYCLSNKYINNTEKYLWKCKEGHVFEKTFADVKNGSWCKECNILEFKNKELEEMKKYAEKFGGRCLSKEYKKSSDSYFWECENGHVFKKSFNSIKRGFWCNECTGIISYCIEDLKKVAKENGGRLLSEVYTGTSSTYSWICINGHKFNRTFKHINDGYWCMECEKVKELQKYAKVYGGTCLSKNYNKATDKYRWVCSEGHYFERDLRSLKRGFWCNECSKLERKQQREK